MLVVQRRLCYYYIMVNLKRTVESIITVVNVDDNWESRNDEQIRVKVMMNGILKRWPENMKQEIH
ncbi:hypothetical protein K0M31_010458 [Melipona bicolor]|uniref:Uncharacterized protein n=1 Tax=Melipona bicolor TaxID=60889 RepID=A0AA40FL49_9HYME|nr:hypothetical protein K0M31_010458 [Melipona bicolor]